jgi:hypothetical protein
VFDTIPVADGPVRPAIDRLIAATTVAAGVAGVALLWPVHPDARGYNTHVQLGMAPCGWPQQYGIPCPTCGVTTAACHVVHGHWLQAVITQPFGAALAIAGLASSVFCLWSLLRGRSVMDVVGRAPYARLVLGGALLLLLSWLYKYLTFTPP